LFSGVRFANSVLGEHFRKPRRVAGATFSGIPKTAFTGSVLFLDVEKKEPFVVGDLPGIGVYALEHNGRKIVFVTPDVRRCTGSNQFVYFSMISPGQSLLREKAAGTILSNFPLFDGTGKLTTTGARLKEHFRYDRKKS
jgi:hypothetical protein